MASPRGSETLAYHVKDLQNELKVKNNEIKSLKKEINVVQEQLGLKDNVIDKFASSQKQAEERALQAETELKSMKRMSKKWDEERKRLQAIADASNKEADRLNRLMLDSAGANSKVMNGSMEDVVKLRNQLAQSRKDILSLKDEIKSLENVVKAKDMAIEQGQADIESAKEANAMRKHDQNVILDLKRQLKDMEDMLGGEHQFGKIVEGEVEELKAALARKQAELEEVLEVLEGQREEMVEAKKLKAEADAISMEAAQKMADAVDISEKAVAAEAERMAGGGFVPMAVHAAQVEALASELESCKKSLQSYQEEDVANKVLMKRILGSVDGEVEKIVCSEHVAEQFGNSTFTIQELRKEVGMLQDVLAVKEGAILALRSSHAAVARAASAKDVELCKVKDRLAKSIGEYEYTLFMNEPPPRQEDTERARDASVYEAQEDSKMYEDLYREQVRLKEENMVLVQHVKELKDTMVSEQEQKTASLALIENEQVNAFKEKDALIMNLNLRLKQQEDVIEQVTKEKDEFVEKLHSLEEEQAKNTDDSQVHDDEDTRSVPAEHFVIPPTVTADTPSTGLEKEGDGDVMGSDSNQDARMPPTEVQRIEILLEEIETLKLERDEAVEESKRYKELSSEEPNVTHLGEAQATPEKPTPVKVKSPAGEQEEFVTPSAPTAGLSSGENSPEKLFARSANLGMVSAGALSSVLDSLISKKQSGADDEELYNEAIQMLQEELSKLTVKMAHDSDLAQKLKGEVGDLKTAQLSAKTTAELLESYNTMSMNLAAQKMVLAQREDAFARHEQQLVNEISALRMEIRRLKGKSTLRSVKKAFSSTVKGIKKSLDGPKERTSLDLTTASPLQDTAKQWSDSPKQ
ncbi:hypothetical protein M9435_001016 [Picochlorum sp. BPE23]|nr:hypothetical protein M9435_001016 [Picochlorum sp. BPE23]